VLGVPSAETVYVTEQIMSSTTTATRREPHSPKTSPLLAALQRDGFIRVPSLLSHLQLSSLRTAAETITQLARKGEWPHLRTVPKQFPPWPNKPPDEKDGSIWGVQHLLHPSMPGRNAFAELYFSDALLDIVRELVGQKDSDTGKDALVMELFNLLVSPTGKRDFELCWHRDDIRPDLDPQEEQRQLDEKSPLGRQLHAQYNIALYEDSSLVVVPGSHRRARTQAEREAEPYAPELPGQVIVTLHAGDGLFYDSNILHRGVYQGIDAETETGRMTLHGSVGLAGHGKQRARQVLQHGVGEWIDKAHFELGGEIGERAEAMRKRLVEMGTGDDVGYSLEG
jgi:hypothetical protein